MKAPRRKIKVADFNQALKRHQTAFFTNALAVLSGWTMASGVSSSQWLRGKMAQKRARRSRQGAADRD